MFERYAALDDLSTRADSGGRYIDAYAAVFNVPQEIRDREGHYYESIHPQAFDRTIEQRAGSFQVLFNHGRTIHGESSERYSMPYGVAAEVRADERGVWTSTKVSDTPLGDEVYQLAQDGALRGMSFSGQFKTTRSAGKRDGLAVKERTEIAMSEYGATPFPAYGAAQIVQVRAQLLTCTTDELVVLLSDLPDEERAAIRAALDVLTPADPGTGDESHDHAATSSVVSPVMARHLLAARDHLPTSL
jgi:HK97 family phage prohead protease